MDNLSQNSVNFLNETNDNNEFNNYTYYPNNLHQETTNVNQAVQPSDSSYDCYDDHFATTNDNIMPINEQISSQYTPQYIDQNVNEYQDSSQYDNNYPQKNYSQIPELKFEIPGYKIIVIPTFHSYTNLNNFDIQDQNQNDQNYFYPSSNIVTDDLSLQFQQYQQFQQQNSFELNGSF
jgi:hypothetical protein